MAGSSSDSFSHHRHFEIQQQQLQQRHEQESGASISSSSISSISSSGGLGRGTAQRESRQTPPNRWQGQQQHHQHGAKWGAGGSASGARVTSPAQGAAAAGAAAGELGASGRHRGLADGISHGHAELGLGAMGMFGMSAGRTSAGGVGGVASSSPRAGGKGMLIARDTLDLPLLGARGGGGVVVGVGPESSQVQLGQQHQPPQGGPRSWAQRQEEAVLLAQRRTQELQGRQWQQRQREDRLALEPGGGGVQQLGGGVSGSVFGLGEGEVGDFSSTFNVQRQHQHQLQHQHQKNLYTLQLQQRQHQARLFRQQQQQQQLQKHHQQQHQHEQYPPQIPLEAVLGVGGDDIFEEQTGMGGGGGGMERSALLLGSPSLSWPQQHQHQHQQPALDPLRTEQQLLADSPVLAGVPGLGLDQGQHLDGMDRDGGYGGSFSTGMAATLSGMDVMGAHGMTVLGGVGSDGGVSVPPQQVLVGRVGQGEAAGSRQPQPQPPQRPCFFSSST